MSVKLYLRDNLNGQVHEYGTSQHDSLVLMSDGSLHYLNMQSMTGTRFPEEGYTFVTEDGNDQREDEQVKAYGVEPFADIGGEERGRSCRFCKWGGETEKCGRCKFNRSLVDMFSANGFWL